MGTGGAVPLALHLDENILSNDQETNSSAVWEEEGELKGQTCPWAPQRPLGRGGFSLTLWWSPALAGKRCPPRSWVQRLVSGVILSRGPPKGEMFARLMTVELPAPCLKISRAEGKLI